MTTRGLPDWSNPLQGFGGDMFFVHENPRHIAALPVALGLAEDGDNRPAFSLEVFGYTRSDGSLDRFGLLALRFAPDYALPDRQAVAFASHPGAKVMPAVPRAGFLRFEGPQGLALPDGLTSPRPLQWTGAGGLAFAARLDAGATSFVSDALVGGIALIDAVAQIEVAGVAARLAVTARFDPDALVREIERQLPDGVLTRQRLINLLASIEDDDALAFDGVEDEPGHLAAVSTFVDRWIGRFADMVPMEPASSGPTYRLNGKTLMPGSMHWDLRETVIVPRGFVVRSNPLETAQDAISQGAELVRTNPLAPFETGLHLVTLYPNLPPRRAGVLILGAQIRVPANPPSRPQSVMASVRFGDGQPLAQAHLHLAPDELLAYEVQTFAFVIENGQARRLTGPWQRHEDIHLTIAPDAFPVDFVRLEAEPALLRLGTVNALCTGLNHDAPWSSSVRLTRESPSVAVGAPKDLLDGKMELSAEAHTGGVEVKLSERPLEDSWIDLGQFPGTGPQRLEVKCRFDDDAQFVLIDCAPEDRTDEPAAVITIHLTRDKPQREWRWLSVSPFAAGYRCRWAGDGDDAPDTLWSESRNPATPLVFASSSRNQSPIPTFIEGAPA